MSRMKELYTSIVDAAELVGISTECALMFLEELGLFDTDKWQRIVDGVLEVEIDRA